MPARYLLGLCCVLILCAATTKAWAADQAPLPNRAGTSAPSVNAGWMGPLLRAGHWNLVRATLTNPTEQPIGGTVLFSFDAQPQVQFGRAVWVPPHATRSVWLPVRAENITNPNKPMNSTVRWVNQVDGVEKQLAREVSLIPTTDDVSTLALLMGSNTDDPVSGAAVALRRAMVNNQRVISLSAQRLSSIAEGWQGIDLLVLNQLPPEVDDAQVQAMRQWLIGGGRMWVILGDVPNPGLERIFGDAWNIQEVGRTTLLKATIEGTREKWDLSWNEPVPMARVLAPGAEVIHRVQGWPATVQFPVGRGLVVVSTLGSRAWVNDKGAAAKPLDLDINPILSRAPVRVNLAAEDFSQLLTQQIGRRIVGRTTVLAVLGGLCVALVVLAVVLMLRQRLEWLSALGGGLAVLAALIMVGAGLMQRGGIPLTLSEAEVVLADPATRSIMATGMLNVYNPTGQGKAGNLHNQGGGVTWPDNLRPTATPARLIWTDLDQWQWHHLPVPSGTIMGATTWRSAAAPASTWPIIRLDQSSAKIELPSSWTGSSSDALLASALGTYALDQESGQVLSMDFGQPLRRGEFARAGVLSDEQRSRQKLAQVLMRRPAMFGQPSLLLWSGVEGKGFGMEDSDYDHRRVGLTIMPVQVLGPRSGGNFVIPAGLLSYASIRAPGGSSSTLFNPQTREWIPQQQNPSRVALRFDVPRTLLPVKIESGRLSIRISAPGRTVSVSLPEQKRSDKPLTSVQSPGGLAVMDLPGEALVVDPQGGLTLVITIGDAEKVDAIWRIEGLELSLSATSARP